MPDPTWCWVNEKDFRWWTDSNLISCTNVATIEVSCRDDCGVSLWTNKNHCSLRHWTYQYRVLKCDVIKMKFLKLWNLSGYSEGTMSKRPSYKNEHFGANCLWDVSGLYSENSIQTLRSFFWVDPKKCRRVCMELGYDLRENLPCIAHFWQEGLITLVLCLPWD